MAELLKILTNSSNAQQSCRAIISATPLGRDKLADPVDRNRSAQAPAVDFGWRLCA